MNENKRPRKLIWITFGLVAFMFVGHLSNLFGLEACERGVLSKYVHGSMWFDSPHGKPIKIVHKHDDLWFLECRLNEIGAKNLRNSETSDDPWPTCQIRPAVPVMPFIVAVDFYEASGPLGASAGRCYMLNFFGLNCILYYNTWLIS